MSQLKQTMHDQLRNRIAEALARPEDFGVVQLKQSINADAAIEPGDFVGVPGVVDNSLQPCYDTTSFADTGTLAGNQEAFHDAFWGIALESGAPKSAARLIKVATKGRWPMRTVPGYSALPGTLVGLAENAEGTELTNLAATVATANLAIGRRVAPDAPTDADVIEVEIISTKAYGGPQAVQ